MDTKTALTAAIIAAVVVYLVVAALVWNDTRRRARGFELVSDPAGARDAMAKMGEFARLSADGRVWRRPGSDGGEVMIRL